MVSGHGEAADETLRGLRPRIACAADGGGSSAPRAPRLRAGFVVAGRAIPLIAAAVVLWLVGEPAAAEDGPTISAVTVVSTPSFDSDGNETADTYVRGDTIEVEVTFTDDVFSFISDTDYKVSGGDDNVRLHLDLGGDDSDLANSRKVLKLKSGLGGGGGGRLRFEYTVVAADTDADGVWVQTASATDMQVVFTVGGTTLRHTASGAAAVLSKSGLPTAGNGDHRVDGSRTPTPVISIAAGAAVTEGGDATFTVTAAPAPASRLTVNLTIAESDSATDGDHVAAGEEGAKSVTLPATRDQSYATPTTSTATYTVATVDDSELEPHSTVTATLTADDGFQVHASAGAASLTVADNDVPEISVAAGLPVTEGGGAAFTLSAHPLPDAALTVNLTVSESGARVAAGNEGTHTVTVPATGTATYTVPTVDNTARDQCSTVTVEVTGGDGYRPHPSDNPASARLKDNDADPPIVDEGSSRTYASHPHWIGEPDTHENMIIVFDRPLWRPTRDPITSFAVSVDGTARTVFRALLIRYDWRGITYSQGRALFLKLTKPIVEGQTVTMSYTKPSDGTAIHDAACIELESFTGLVVSNGVDTEAPSVSGAPSVSSTPANGDAYGSGENVEVTVTFDEPVIVTGSPRLELAVGSNIRQAAYHRGSGTTRLVFRYQVTAADADGDGISVAANKLTLAGGTIADAAGNAAVLTHAALSAGASHKVDGTIAPTGAAAPGARSLGVADATGAEGATLAFAVTLNAAANAAVTADYATADGTATAGEDYVAAVGTLTFEPGETAKAVEVATILDAADEGVETFALKLSNADGATIADGEATGTVTEADEAGGPEPHLACKQPEVAAARTLRTASATGGGIANHGLEYDFELTLEMEEHRDGSAQPVELGCVAVAAPGHAFRYSITDGDTARFRVGEKDGALRYVGSGEDAARTPFYLLTVTARPDEDGGKPLRLAVRVVIAAAEDGSRARMLRIGLTGFARTTAATAVQVIGRRFTPPATDPPAVAVTLNGRSLDLAGAGGVETRAALFGAVLDALGIRAEQGAGAVWVAPTGAQLVAGSAFSVDPGAGGSRWGVWGSGDVSGFSGEVGGFRQDGTVLAALLGTDYRFAPNARAGLAASYSRLELTSASESEGDASLGATLVSAHPYLFWMPAEWLGLWGLAGLGVGTSSLTEAEISLPPGSLRSWLGAVGQRAELWSGGGVSLAAKSDGFVTGIRQPAVRSPGAAGPLAQVEALAWRARVLVEAGAETRAEDVRLSGRLELGARLDGGDAERGLGAEAGAELGVAHPGTGLGLAARGRLLILHENPNIRDWGASAALSWQPADHGHGPTVSLAPAWGRPASGVDALWSDPRAVLGAAEGGAAGAGGRSPLLPDSVEVTVGYVVDGLALEVFGRRLAAGGGAGYRLGLGGSLEY